jgi:hypothetical protein
MFTEDLKIGTEIWSSSKNTICLALFLKRYHFTIQALMRSSTA